MRQRTIYPKPLKAQVVQECLQPGISLARVALRRGINANLVREWILGLPWQHVSAGGTITLL